MAELVTGLTCPTCGAPIAAGDLICMECGANLARAYLPAPTTAEPQPDPSPATPVIVEPTVDASAPPRQAPANCPHCGAELPDPSPPVCMECLRPLADSPAQGGSSLVLRVGDTEFVLGAGESLALGRDPAISPAASALANFDNVSRRHALVRVDSNGHATVSDDGSTNGTFVNDRQLRPGETTEIGDGDVLRLAARCVLHVGRA